MTRLLPLAVGVLAFRQDKAFDPLQAVRETAALLRGGTKEAADDLRRRLEARLAEDKPGDSIARACFVFLLHSREKSWDPKGADAKLFEAYAANLPPAMTPDWLRARVMELQGRKPLSLLARHLSLAHFEEYLRSEEGTDPGRADGLAQIAGATNDRGWQADDGRLIDLLRGHLKEGRLLQALADGPSRDSDRFEVQYLRGYILIQAALKDRERFSEAHKHLMAIREGAPAHCRALADAVKKFIVCKKCSGTGKRSCDVCRGKGSLHYTCGTCGGDGKVFKGVSATTGRPVIEPCKDCQQRGQWDEDCPSCDGGFKSCFACKGVAWKQPAMEEIAVEVDCKFCGGTGFGFRYVRAPCPFCRGVGRLLRPRGAEEKTIGPVP